jgi:uncharacterized protein (DUF2249 family)
MLVEETIAFQKVFDWKYDSNGDFIKSFQMFGDRGTITTEGKKFAIEELVDGGVNTLLQTHFPNPIYDSLIIKDIYAIS